MGAAFRFGLSRLRHDDRGASVIEFALFVPILAFMVMGVSDVAMGYSTRLTLEQAAHRALEKVAVGSVQSDYSTLRAEAANAAGVPIGNVVVDQWLECNRARQASFDGTCGDGEMVSRYVRVTVNSTYRPRFSYGPLGNAFGGRSSDGTVALAGTAALRVQ